MLLDISNNLSLTILEFVEKDKGCCRDEVKDVAVMSACILQALCNICQHLNSETIYQISTTMLVNNLCQIGPFFCLCAVWPLSTIWHIDLLDVLECMSKISFKPFDCYFRIDEICC